MKYLMLLLVIPMITVAQQKDKQSALQFKVPDTLSATQYMVEVKVQNTKRGFYGSTFNGGRIGFQQQGKNRKFIFQLQQPQQLLATGLGVRETKKGQLEWDYAWEQNLPYRLLVTVLADSAAGSSYYTGYVYLPAVQQWKLLGSYRTAGGSYLQQSGLAIAGEKGSVDAHLILLQAWLQRSNGTLKTLEAANFAGNLGGAGTKDGQLFISNKPTRVVSIGELTASATTAMPVFSVTNHVDSLAQAGMDRAMILQAVKDGKIDTTGSINDIYYQIVKQGTGAIVELTDTVTVHYKGWLLKDNTVFDQTREKPAIFPQTRLVKSWPIGLSTTRVGGTTRLFIPSGQAYSTRSRSKAIPPNSVLVFEIEVLDAKKVQ